MQTVDMRRRRIAGLTESGIPDTLTSVEPDLQNHDEKYDCQYFFIFFIFFARISIEPS
jgi:hypothetical protein